MADTLERIEAAEREVAALCKGARWRMCVPVHPEDSDIVISDALRSARDEIASYRAAAQLEEGGPGSSEDVRKAMLQLLAAMPALYPQASGLSHAMGLLIRDAAATRQLRNDEDALLLARAVLAVIDGEVYPHARVIYGWARQCVGGELLQATVEGALSNHLLTGGSYLRDVATGYVDAAKEANRNATATQPENTNAPRLGGALEVLTTTEDSHL